MLTGTLAFAQNKNVKATMEVDGVCMMCKARIEKACLNTKGVKYAQWSVDTHKLSLIYDARKTNINAIQKQIAEVGHDTKDVKATDEAYSKVHACCKYRNDDVQKEHQEKADNAHQKHKS